MGQSRQEFGFHGRGEAALAGVVVGINILLDRLYVAKTLKWLLPGDNVLIPGVLDSRPVGSGSRGGQPAS
jgi:hypothetical protein